MSTALLLSGGVESTALAYWKRPEISYFIDYGQAAAARELAAAKAVSRRLNISHVVLTIDIKNLGGGIMAGAEPLPASRHAEWWPFRNQFLLTVAGMHAVKQGVNRLLIGTVRSDRRHRDGTPNFLSSINRLMKHQEGGVQVLAPALELNTRQLVLKAGLSTPVLLETHSCHRGSVHCCDCPGCFKRLKLFRSLGLTE